MVNEWYKIWNNRNERFNSINTSNEREVFMEMIRIDGGDITNEVTYDSYRDNYNGVKKAINIPGGGQYLR